VVDPATGKNVEDKDRTSRSVYLEAAEDEIVKRIEQRAAMATGVPMENFERLQVVKYEPGQFYKAHFDYLDAEVEVKKGGQRVVTVFAYLNDLPEDEPGGGTKFHAISKTVKPRMGSAALWYNMVKDPTTTVPMVDSSTLHSGEPVVKSTKYGLNVWARTLPQRK
jgi:prolyl 4-hydroxylase